MKTILVFAMAHPILTLFGIWAVSGAVRVAVSSATGYDALAVAVDGIKAAGKAKRAAGKAPSP
jgi:hypothetical protein